MPVPNFGGLITREGKKAWQETIAFLKKQAPLPAFTLHLGLCLSAMDHAIDLVEHDLFGHTSSNGDSFTKRIERRCGSVNCDSAENVAIKSKVPGMDLALKTVLSLIIDDGVASRGHRTNIFNPAYLFVGHNSRVQKKYVITVMNFTGKELPVIDPKLNPSEAGMDLGFTEAE